MDILNKSRGFSTRSLSPPPERPMASPPHVAPTDLEARMADLEGGAHGFAFPSGRAAIACLMDLVNSGAHVIVSNGLHGGRYRLLEDVCRRTSGIRLSYVDPTDRAALESVFVEDETKLVWIESPGSPRAELADLDMVAAFAAEHDLISVCDNTNCTPYLQRPLDHGFNISVSTAPGYLYGGVLEQGAVAVVANGQDFLVDKLGFLRMATGAAISAHEAELASRALASLAPRMNTICDTAERIAAFLAGHSGVTEVFYPGSAERSSVDLAKRQMTRSGGFLPFVVDGDIDRARAFIDRLDIIAVGDGPSGPGSVIDHPTDAIYASVPEEIRAGLGLSDGLCRLWVGLEDSDDLIEDLRAALG
jgi:cystathionine gamma-lyase